MLFIHIENDSPGSSLYLWIAVAIAMAFALLRNGSLQKRTPEGDGSILLRMHWLYAAIGGLGAALGLIFLVVMFFTSSQEKHSHSILMIMTIFFWLLSFPPLMLFKNHRLRFDMDKIESWNFWGNKSMVRWSEIEQVTFNHFSGYLKIRDKNGIRIKASHHLAGFKNLVAQMEMSTPFRAKDINIPG
jgi:hypothetical protein